MDASRASRVNNVIEFDQPFGKVAIRYCYVEYDGPKVFLGTTRDGTLLFFIAADETELAEVVFICVSVTEDDVALCESGHMYIRSLFENSPITWIVTESSGTSGRVDAVPSADIQDEWLPEKEVSLSSFITEGKGFTSRNVNFHLPAGMSEEMAGSENPGISSLAPYSDSVLKDMARSAGRSFVALEMSSERPSLRSFARIVNESNSYIEAISLDYMNRERHSSNSLKHVELDISGAMAASFVLVARISDDSTLLDSLAGTYALRGLTYTLMRARNPGAFIDHLRERSRQTRRRARALLEAVADGESTFRAATTDGNDLFWGTLTPWQAREALQAVENTPDETEELVFESAALTALNLSRNTFEVETAPSGGQRIAGTIEPGKRAEMNGLSVSLTAYKYKVTIRRAYAFAPGENTRGQTNTLVAIDVR